MKQVVFLFILGLGLGYPLQGFGLQVNFKDEAVVDGPMLTLGDVAEIEPAARAKDLGAIVLFPAPGPGKERCFQSRTLKAYIFDAVSGQDSIQWKGAEVVCVRPDGKRLGPGEIRSMINNELKAAVSHLQAEKVNFELRNPPESLAVPTGRLESEIIFSDPDILESRRVTVIIKVDGQAVENLTLAGRVQAYLPVVAAARKLRRGDVLKQGDLLTTAKNIAELREPVLDPGAVLGKRLKRTVAMNQIIGKHDLDSPDLVKRRQIVTMVLKKGPLVIRAKGKSSRSGKKGEVIMIENMRSQREVPCRVVGPGLVRVEY
ncbi:MAG: flagellar basal body P-ring formation chaperone FlgA [Desulfohalobiaceae bacterium]|nr:flagellar basal body P-ring formation chaperone FlgA [Desulfohalobiaceae bacterium]